MSGLYGNFIRMEVTTIIALFCEAYIGKYASKLALKCDHIVTYIPQIKTENTDSRSREEKGYNHELCNKGNGIQPSIEMGTQH